MAFESLSERLQNAIKMFRGTKEITEEDLKEPLRHPNGCRTRSRCSAARKK